MKTKQKWLTACLCGGLSAICIGFGISRLHTTQMASANTKLMDFLAQEYVVGDNISIPNYEFEKGNEKITAKKILYLPSGQAYVGESITLNEMGEYVIEYYAYHGGETYTHKEAFQVSNYLFSIDGEKSKMLFGDVASLTQYKANERSGMIVDLSPGETLEYNKVIDFSQAGSTQTFVDFAMLPHSIGTADANKIWVTLTDIYDSSNYITFECRKIGTGQNFMERLTYVMSYASNGQMPQGLSAKAQNKSNFVYEGNYYKRHLNDIYGTETYFPMSGYSITTGTNIALDDTKVGLQDLKLAFDYETKRVYTNGTLIVDLDDPALQKKPWKGFETGECKLSISVSGYNGSSCRMLFNAIGGENTQVNSTLYDNEKPEIFVDTSEFDSLDYAVVGKPLVLPLATARDSYSGNCKVETKVYTHYGSSTQSLVNVADGKFVPKSEKNYTIVYTAKDRCGNVQTKTYSIDAKRITNELSLDFGNATKSVAVGQLVSLSQPVVTNAVGNYYVTVSVKKDGAEEILYQVDKDSIHTTNYQFRPMFSGEYEIVYSYSDYVTNKQNSYTLSVTANGTDVLIGDATLPKYIIKDATYATPVFNGYTFVNGNAVTKKTELYVSNSETYTESDKVLGDTFRVTDGGDYCWFHFVLGEDSKTYKVPLVDVNYGKSPLALHKYFVGYAGEPNAGSENTTYTLANQSGVYALDFVNALPAFDFSVGFSVPKTANYNKVRVVLTDSVDTTQKLVFNYRNTSSTSYFSINNGPEYDVGKKLNNASLVLSYKNEERLVSAGVNMSYTVENGFDGKAWKGFSSGKVWLQIFVEDTINADAPKITIDKVNNQFIYKMTMVGMNLTSDVVEPQISTPTLKGYFAKGSTVKIVPIQYGDVLDPNARIKFTVKSPNGQIVVSKDGVRLENLPSTSQSYEIELIEYGSYSISYLVEDSAGNKIPYAYGISVVDEVAPNVQINEHASAVYCGYSIELASLTIQDDISDASNCKVHTYIQTVDGKRFSIKENLYTPTKAGVYEVWYYVTDESGNVTIVGYTFTAV